jgi:hypothetical protein
MEQLLGASWRSTVIGFVLAMVTYFHELGPNLPETGRDWLGAAMAAGMFAFGKVVKDWNVTNATHVSPAAVRPETPPAP